MLFCQLARAHSLREICDGLDKCASEHELLVNDGLSVIRMAFSTRMVFSRGARNLQTYACWYKTSQNDSSGDSYDVSVNNGRITQILTRNGQSTEVTELFTPNMMIVDFS